MSIRVLVVDDSALMRKMIPMILSSDNEIEVVGTAIDGDFALRKIPELKPDVITLDVDMPRLDGLATLRAIVRDYGTPVVLVSSLTREGAATTIEGLQLGAFDFVPKPHEAISVHITEVSEELIKKVRAAARSRPKIRISDIQKRVLIKKTLPEPQRFDRVVAIGISTGGPQALSEILPKLPSDFPYPILIVQHMPEGFIDIFAKRLDSLCEVEVKEAKDGDPIRNGRVLMAPGGRHLKVKRTPYGLIAVISASPPVGGHRPSATVLLSSVAKECGAGSIGVIMTGMGDDGVEGLKKIKEAGGITIAQDEESSVIFGMPKVAIEKGYAEMVLGLKDIVPTLISLSLSEGQRRVI